MTFDLAILLLVLQGTVIIGGVAMFAARGLWQRTMMLGIVSGLLLYSGVGGADREVPINYLLFYFGFLIAFILAFWFFRVTFVGLSIKSGRALTQVLGNVDHHIGWLFVIWVYV